MSKERYLLQKILATRWLNNTIRREVKELLAQHEQTEQEPVAWKVIDGTNGNYMFSRIKPTERSYKYDVVIPLYTSAQKREPLSDDVIQKNIPFGMILMLNEFEAGVKFAEKEHGIGVDYE
jgi:hypothetical protein